MSPSPFSKRFFTRALPLGLMASGLLWWVVIMVAYKIWRLWHG
jgi:hypothetical protein